MSTFKKTFFSPLFIVSILYSIVGTNDLLATWTHEEIIEELENCSPQTIQLYMDFKEDVTDPNQLAALLNLNSSKEQVQEQVSPTIQSKWTFQEIQTDLQALNNIHLNKLYEELADQTNDPDFLAETLGLIKHTSCNTLSSSLILDNLSEDILKISRLEHLREIDRESRNFDNVDVHQFNRLFVLKHKDFVLSTAQTKGLNSNYSLDTIIEKLTAKKSSQFNITNSVNTLRQHLTREKIDHETSLNVLNLLSNVWSACEKLEHKGNLFQLHDHRKVNAINYFAWSLEENIATQGGCYPGFSGRFFRDLFTLIMFLEQNE